MNLIRTSLRTGLIAALLFLHANSSFAQSTDSQVDVKELCKQVLCRTPNFKLRLDNQDVFESDVETPLPVLVNNKLISVFPGETVFIEASVTGKEIKLERAVAINEHPERTLVFKFTQVDKQKDMMLEVSNPFPEVIKFKMGFMKVDSSKIYGTTSCPVPEKLSLLEHWPHPIFQILLTQAKILDKRDKRICN